MSLIIGLAIGFVAGWVALERPAWATELIAKLKAKLGV